MDEIDVPWNEQICKIETLVDVGISNVQHQLHTRKDARKSITPAVQSQAHTAQV